MRYTNILTQLIKHKIQTAVRLILPGELAKHAISEGTKVRFRSLFLFTLDQAITKFNSNGDEAGPVKRGCISKSARSGLQFPVGRITTMLKAGTYAERVSPGTQNLASSNNLKRYRHLPVCSIGILDCRSSGTSRKCMQRY